jgi:DNA helicase-2/ATP-dependent DNA helicase PcrA
LLPPQILAGLNPQQRAAVEHAEGPLLVLAGAGSGKTRMLTHRIAALVASGRARPWEILAVTFTNKAAREMRERVDRLLPAQASGIWVSTFHSTCVRILRREIAQLGYEVGFSIYDQSDSLALVKRVLKAVGASERSYPPRGVRAEIDRLKNRGLLPDELMRQDTLEAKRLADIYQRYQKELRRANALDFGDLLLLTVRLFERFPAVLEHYQRRWRYVLVDEYQDTNPIQYRFLRQLVAAHRNLCVVGDEDQSIYAFREADIRNILDFEKDFPGAEVVRLEQNYRSTQPILDAAGAVVANNSARKGKRLFTERRDGEPLQLYQADDERGEAAWVVGRLLELRESGGRLGDAAIFYRTHAQSRPLEEELLKYNLPYAVVGGTRFYDRAEVKDALGYLRVISNPDDTESLRRVINVPARGIGDTTVERLLELAAERDVSLLRALGIALDEGRLRNPAAGRVGEFLKLIEELRGFAQDAAPAGLLSHVLEQTGYLDALEREGTVEAEGRVENLRELLAAVEEFEIANSVAPPASAEPDADEPRSLLDLFLEQVTLLSEADGLPADGDRVVLMTVHVAKGLEFPCVFVVGLEEGIFPHFASLTEPDAIEEERRLCYVAMTRAQDRLHLSHAALRRMHGSIRQNPPSRFLDEIPEQLMIGPRPSRSFGSQPQRWYDAPLPARWPEPPRRAPARTPDRAGVRVEYDYAQSSTDDPPPLRKGSRVEHPVFGAGTVQLVVGSGVETKLEIRFDRAGVKTLKLRYAQLELLSI